MGLHQVDQHVHCGNLRRKEEVGERVERMFDEITAEKIYEKI